MMAAPSATADPEALLIQARELFSRHIREISSPQLCKKPCVSVFMCTFNHASFVAQAIESVLMQKISFTIELIIIDDASTDGTREILIDYQQRYPEIIRLMLADKNLWNALPGMLALTPMAALEVVRGEFVCELDGDDHWTDPHKLTKQLVTFDQYPQITLCFHPTMVIQANGEVSRPLRAEQKVATQAKDRPRQIECMTLADDIRQVTLTDLLRRRLLFNGIYFHSSSLMFRAKVLRHLPFWVWTVLSRDYALIILSALGGPCLFLPETMSAYRIHAAGEASLGGRQLDPARDMHRFRVQLAFLQSAATSLPPSLKIWLRRECSPVHYRIASLHHQFGNRAAMRDSAWAGLREAVIPPGMNLNEVLALHMLAWCPRGVEILRRIKRLLFFWQAPR